jgi:quinol monooxygenase YgiN
MRTSNQVTVVVRLRAKPGMETRVRQELANLLAPTRQERGCINFDMHESP